MDSAAWTTHNLLVPRICVEFPEHSSVAASHPEEVQLDWQQVPLGLSKKDPLLRRKELLGSGKGSLAAALLSAASAAAAALLHGKNSGDFVVEAVRGGSDGAS